MESLNDEIEYTREDVDASIKIFEFLDDDLPDEDRKRLSLRLAKTANGLLELAEEVRNNPSDEMAWSKFKTALVCRIGFVFTEGMLEQEYKKKEESKDEQN